MENQALFSSKDKSQKIKCRQLQFLFGVLSVIGPDCFSGAVRLSGETGSCNIEKYLR